MSPGRPKVSIAERVEEGLIPEDWEEHILAMASEGASDVEIRAYLKISDDLWYRWIEEDDGFSRTTKTAKMLCHAKWEQMGRKMAFGEVEGNPTTWIFNMKNRFGWKDKTETEVTATVSQSTTLSIDKTTLDDIIAKL